MGASDRLRNVLGHLRPSELRFDGNVKQWSKSIENEFAIHNVPDPDKTTYAIGVGLKANPEVQKAMEARLASFQTASGGEVWPWADFVDDLRKVNGEF